MSLFRVMNFFRKHFAETVSRFYAVIDYDRWKRNGDLKISQEFRFNYFD